MSPGKRNRERPKMRFMDILKEDIRVAARRQRTGLEADDSLW